MNISITTKHYEENTVTVPIYKYSENYLLFMTLNSDIKETQIVEHNIDLIIGLNGYHIYEMSSPYRHDLDEINCGQLFGGVSHSVIFDPITPYESIIDSDRILSILKSLVPDKKIINVYQINKNKFYHIYEDTDIDYCCDPLIEKIIIFVTSKLQHTKDMNITQFEYKLNTIKKIVKHNHTLHNILDKIEENPSNAKREILQIIYQFCPLLLFTCSRVEDYINFLFPTEGDLMIMIYLIRYLQHGQIDHDKKKLIDLYFTNIVTKKIESK